MDNRPITFFSWKLSNTQRKYSVTEIELLAIVKTLKESKGMLWGQNIKVFTDHAHLMRDALGLTLDRVCQWRLLLEEYGPKIVYIKGIHNTNAVGDPADDVPANFSIFSELAKTSEKIICAKNKQNKQSTD